MRFPSLSRRDEPTPPADGRGGTVATDTRPDGRTDVEGRSDGGTPAADSTTRRAPADGSTAAGRATVDDSADSRADARRAAEARAATARSTVHGSSRARTTTGTADRDRTVDERDPRLDGDRAEVGRTADRERIDDSDRPVNPVDEDRGPAGDANRDVPATPVGPRPRASLLATLGLIVGVGGILFVLTGALAGYGIALGAFGAVLAVLGLIATRRRHIAGKSDALLGIAFGLGAVVLGVLAMTGQYDWPSTDGDLVARFREWLDSQFVDRW
ncbi:thrombospondin [Micromonospora sp. DT48]|uniref:thrombospondin n=1 Tax=Micromonospora sp. DT48 TaxID=3393429 RepID=UPI003CE75975